jgi:hypothetical protein
MSLRGCFLAFVLGLAVGLWVLDHQAPAPRQIDTTSNLGVRI